jgi:hypothetical protein
MTTEEIIDALLQQKQLLEEHFSDLLAACRNDAERAILRGSYQRATDQWNAAVNATLRTNDPHLRGLIGDLDDVQEDVKTMIAAGDDLAKILNRVAAGIGIGAKIVALVK